MGRTKADRIKIVNEVKMNCIEHDLMEEIGTKVLFKMLDEYVSKGTPFVGKQLGILKLSPQPRKYIVKLYNDPSKVDTVIISVDDTSSSFERVQRDNEELSPDEDA
jgi:hypothetical protein